MRDVLEREFGGTRYTPAPLLRRLADAGRTGRKSGRGFYDYGQQETRGAAGSPDQSRPDLAAVSPPGTVTVIGPGAVAGTARRSAEPHSDRAAELGSFFEAAGISVTSNPAHPTDLGIGAVGPGGGVLGPAPLLREYGLGGLPAQVSGAS